MDNFDAPKGLTVKELKEIIKDWPEEDGEGSPTEVWIATGEMLSSPCLGITMLNFRGNREKEWADILFEPSESIWEEK